MDAISAYEVAEGRLFETYGLAATTRFVDLPFPWRRTRVVEAGEGPPVVLVHGGGGHNGSSFAPLLAGLRGVRAIAVDRPGAPHDGTVDYRRIDLRSHAVGFLEAVLDALELPRVPFVANSMGGLWTFWLAQDRPERVTAIAQLGCPAVLLDTSAPRSMRLLAIPWVGERLLKMGRPSARMARKVLKQMGHGRSVAEGRIPPATYEYFASLSAMPSFAKTFSSIVRRVIWVSGTRAGMALDEEELSRIEQPTLFIWGEDDTFGSPEVGYRAVRAMPHASIEVLAGAGHLPWLDDPDRCADLVSRFIGSRVV